MADDDMTDVPETVADAPAAAAAPPPPAAAAPPAATSPPAAPAPTAAADDASRPNPRKVREGVVHSAAMDKTVVVKVVERVRHPRYAKTMQRTTKLYAQDDTNDCREGDRVRLAETRPLSKLKRWRVVEILERAR